MMVTYAAIPTSYAGVNFRSRLEARWAAFFDLAGWPWEYEPIDLAGWIPDFRLARSVLVEVKPIDWYVHDDAANWQLVWDVVPEIVRLSTRHEDFPEVLLLGNGPLKNGESFWGNWMLGMFIRESWDCADGDRALLAEGYGEHKLDFHADCGSYAYRIGGEYDGDHHLRGIDPDLPERFWRQAGNHVQWKKP